MIVTKLLSECPDAECPDAPDVKRAWVKLFMQQYKRHDGKVPHQTNFQSSLSLVITINDECLISRDPVKGSIEGGNIFSLHDHFHLVLLVGCSSKVLISLANYILSDYFYKQFKLACILSAWAKTHHLTHRVDNTITKKADNHEGFLRLFTISSQYFCFILWAL